ncbi:MAG TPA: hypothetical protein VKN99_06390 [Polyangia bacterium]|nr:hypothetical protein [Polyangia bacterium]
MPPPEAAPPPLIDLDGTVFVQFGLYLLMLLILHVLVFRPFLQARSEREDRIEGERRRAREMEEAAQKKIADFEARLEKAKQAGIQMRNQARGQAAAREREILERARTETQALLESRRLQAHKAGQAARQRLHTQAEAWGRTLAARILGREVA